MRVRVPSVRTNKSGVYSINKALSCSWTMLHVLHVFPLRTGQFLGVPASLCNMHATARMTLYRRPSDVGPDHFVIMHKESDGRELAIGFIHQPMRSPLSSLGAWEWNIEHHQRAGRSLPAMGNGRHARRRDGRTEGLLGIGRRSDQVAAGHKAALVQRCRGATYDAHGCGYRARLCGLLKQPHPSGERKIDA